MRRPSRRIAAGLLAVFLAGMAGGTSLPRPVEPGVADQAAALYVPPTFYQAVDQAREQGLDSIEMDLIVPAPADMQRVRDRVTELGGEVLLEERTYAQVKVPLVAADTLPTTIPVTAVGTNQIVRADQAMLASSNTELARSAVSGLIGHNFEPSDILQFRQRHGVTGTGVTIAVIDSGIDPGHPDLRETSDGKPKLVDWKDFTGEGLVKTPHTVEWAATYIAPNGVTYRLPAKPAASQTARFGFWEESKLFGRIARDLNRNNSPIDRFGVLLVESRQPGLYDTVYVDTNDDWDFNDERPMQVFRDSQHVGTMGRFRSGDVAEQQVHFVVSDIDGTGDQVEFGFDGHGHGTQVAGVLAASSAEGLTGVAPGAQLMALKVVNANEQGGWFEVRRAIRYAVERGASIINVSLGGLSTASVDDSVAALELDEAARNHGVLIIMASDNTGPGLSSGTTIGDPHEMLAVGAYYSPAMWQRDYGYVVPHEGLWWRSGMGPRADGSYAPNLVAPGGSPTTSPRWYHATGYVTAAGTSIATPHVSGSAALLMEAGRRNGLLHDRLSIKRAMEFGARKVEGLEVYEQGHGLLRLEQAFEHLRMINGVPTLAGEGGLLARSYRPGGTSVTVSNLGTELTRVDVESSAAWVRSALQSLTMPPKESRQLPLRFNPPAVPGVHSAFLRLQDRSKYGTSLDIPITYVRPVALTEKERTYSATEQLVVTRYKRYFVEVLPGSARLQVSTRVLVSPQGESLGTVIMQVFRPDGNLAFRSYEIGAHGTGLSTVFTTEQPLEGVWEVVVTALPDTEGANPLATYTLDLEATPSLMDLPIRLNVTAGTTTTHTIRLANPYRSFYGRAEAYGLVRQDDSQPWQVKKDLNGIDAFSLSTSAALVRLEIDNPIPATASLHMDLYRAGAPPWRSVDPKIERRDLSAGQYSVFVGSNGPAPRGLQYQYRRLVAPLAYNLSLNEEPRRRDRGQSWTVPITVYAPTSPGRYQGQVILWDMENAESVAWYPIEVSVSQPALAVTPMVSQLRMEEPGMVVLEVRDSQTRALVSGTVTVNGQRYLARDGQVTVSVRPTESVQKLQVEINLPAYQYFNQEIPVPVRKTWGAHPTGVDTSPEISKWRRKVEFLLP